jgi:hypothetical protein
MQKIPLKIEAENDATVDKTNKVKTKYECKILSKNPFLCHKFVTKNKHNNKIQDATAHE